MNQRKQIKKADDRLEFIGLNIERKLVKKMKEQAKRENLKFSPFIRKTLNEVFK
jgi:hypothetical protein